ncbi:hypothetical protein HY484_03285 [Candidatus Woesearchaeota archaeon]|nr:hypothetical protein [Candidatus Woesearchaeota archaeon]
MSVVGIQFNKIVIDKKNPAKGKVNVNNNVAVKDVHKTDLTFGSAKQNALQFDFEFKVHYDPGIADLTFNGFLTYFEKPETIEEILKSWKKDKKIPKEVMTPVLNSILAKCNIEALLLSREVNLPPPMPMPKVDLK